MALYCSGTACFSTLQRVLNTRYCRPNSAFMLQHAIKHSDTELLSSHLILFKWHQTAHANWLTQDSGHALHHYAYVWLKPACLIITFIIFFTLNNKNLPLFSGIGECIWQTRNVVTDVPAVWCVCPVWGENSGPTHTVLQRGKVRNVALRNLYESGQSG